MKILPVFAAAVAERRFLSDLGKSKIDATNQNLMFDVAVNDAAGTAAATGAISLTKGAMYFGAKDAANQVTGLVDGTSYLLKAPNGTVTGNWKTHSRNVKSKADGAANMTAAKLPNCDNKFVESSAAAAAAKETTAIQAKAWVGTASAPLEISFTNAQGVTDSGLAAGEKVYLACKPGGKPHTNLKCGTVYTLAAGTTAASDFKIHKSTAGDVKGLADNTTGITLTDMWFVEVGSATPKVQAVCTNKAGSARMAAFVSGLIAYALLI